MVNKTTAEPIRILQVFGKMNRGGAETMLMNLYRKIDRSKIQFDFMVHTDESCAYDDEIRELGGEIFRVPRFTFWSSFKYIVVWIAFLKKHKKYKCIHAHITSTAVIFLFIAKCYGIKVIAHSHNTSNGTGVSAVIKTTLSYPLRFFCDYYLACSKEAGEWMFGGMILKSNRFFVLKNGIDIPKFTFCAEQRLITRQKLNIDKKFVIGHVGRFEEQKNHDFLIKVFYEISRRNEQAVLLLVGDGLLKAKIEDDVRKLGIKEKVVFLGVRSDIPDLLQAMDVFLFPSLYEGLGIVLIEAQANGLKCVVSETIPKEVEITDLISFISLNESPQHWADLILTCQYERYNRQLEIRSAGYEIQTTAKWLEEFYLTSWSYKEHREKVFI